MDDNGNYVQSLSSDINSHTPIDIDHGMPIESDKDGRNADGDSLRAIEASVMSEELDSLELAFKSNISVSRI